LLEVRKKTGRKKRECKRADKKEVRELEKMGKWLDRLLSR
jgi:hypothetical protein